MNYRNRRKQIGMYKRLNVRETEKEKSHFIDASIIILIVSALGYYVAYNYQKGYRGYFGLNDVVFLNVDLNNLIVSLSIVGTFICVSYLAYRGLVPKDIDITNPIIAIFLKHYSKPAGILGFFWVLSGMKYWKFYSGALFLLLILYFVLPIFSQRQVNGYMNKLQAQLEFQDKEAITVEKVIYVWNKYTSAKFAIILSIFLFSSSIAYGVGVFNAKYKKSFLITNYKKTEYVVIDRQQDKVIIAPINIKTREIEREFIFIELKSNIDKPLVLKEKKFKDGLILK